MSEQTNSSSETQPDTKTVSGLNPIERLNEAYRLISYASAMLCIMQTADYDGPRDGRGGVIVDTSTVQDAAAGIDKMIWEALYKITDVKDYLKEGAHHV